jgi:hypothetical protein
MFKFDRVKYKFYENRFKMDRFVLYHCFVALEDYSGLRLQIFLIQENF